MTKYWRQVADCKKHSVESYYAKGKCFNRPLWRKERIFINSVFNCAVIGRNSIFHFFKLAHILKNTAWFFFLCVSKVKHLFQIFLFYLTCILSHISMPGYNLNFSATDCLWRTGFNLILKAVGIWDWEGSLLILSFFLLYLASYLVTVSKVSIDHFIWYELLCHQDRIFAHSHNTSSRKAGYKCQEFSNKTTTTTYQIGLYRISCNIVFFSFLVVVFTSFQGCKKNYTKLFHDQACWNFKTTRKEFLTVQQCHIMIQLQDTFIIKRRRITRVVTLRSSSELESLSLSFKSW